MTKSILTTTLALLSFSLASCTGGTNPLATENGTTQQSTLGGVATGAIGGYLLGSDSTDRRQKATAGALAGAGVGYLYGQNQTAQ